MLHSYDTYSGVSISIDLFIGLVQHPANRRNNWKIGISLPGLPILSIAAFIQHFCGIRA